MRNFVLRHHSELSEYLEYEIVVHTKICSNENNPLYGIYPGMKKMLATFLTIIQRRVLELITRSGGTNLFRR